MTPETQNTQKEAGEDDLQIFGFFFILQALSCTYYLFYFQYLRSPERMSVLVQFGMAVIAAWGASRIFERLSPRTASVFRVVLTHRLFALQKTKSIPHAGKLPGRERYLPAGLSIAIGIRNGDHLANCRGFSLSSTSAARKPWPRYAFRSPTPTTSFLET